MAYRILYTWYFDTPTQDISNPLLGYYEPVSFGRNEGVNFPWGDSKYNDKNQTQGSIYHMKIYTGVNIPLVSKYHMTACDTFYLFDKYQSWYLTPGCGLEVQKPTLALMSIKGPGNTFDLIPKWTRTLPLGVFQGIFIEHLPFQQKQFQISKLIFDSLLWAWGGETHPGTYVS